MINRLLALQRAKKFPYREEGKPVVSTTKKRNENSELSALETTSVLTKDQEMNKRMRIDQIQMKLLTDTIAIRSENIPQIGKLQDGRPVLSGDS